MGMLGTTKTRGWKPTVFRNQPVHEFYSHLQALLREIAPDNSLNNLFARPFSTAQHISGAEEVSWMSDVTGEVRAFPDLSPQEQSEIGSKLAMALERVRGYSLANRASTGLAKDYANFLQSVAVSPDLRNVLVLNGEPIIIHWGFVQEGSIDPRMAEFAGWQDFLTQVKAPTPAPAPAYAPIPPAPPVAKPETKAQPASPSAPVKPAEQAKPKPAKPEEPLREPPDYQWVKWLALILAIIILLLLIPHCHRQRMPSMPGMGPQAGGGMPSAGGGMPSGQGGGGGSSGQPSGQPGGQPPGGGQQGQPGAQQGQPSGEKGPGSGQDQTGKKTSDERDSDILIQVAGEVSHTLLARKGAQNVKWSLETPENAAPGVCRIDGSPDGKTGSGPKIKLNFSPTGKDPQEIRVKAVTAEGETTVYRFLVEPQGEGK